MTADCKVCEQFDFFALQATSKKLLIAWVGQLSDLKFTRRLKS